MSTRQTVYEAVALGIRAWLVIDRLKNGLAFGGFRFSDSVSLDQVCQLASASAAWTPSPGTTATPSSRLVGWKRSRRNGV
jgi:hypothetical protein